MFKKLFILIFITLLIISTVLFYQLDKELNTELPIEVDSFLKVKAGSSINSFASELKAKNWISTRLWLKGYARIFPEKTKIKKGTYLIKKNSSLEQLLTQLVEGKEYQFSITFIEGTRFKDALLSVADHDYINKTLTDLPIDKISLKLGIDAKNPEGWLFPDTYAFTAGTDDLTILKRAFVNMKSLLSREWGKRADNLPYSTPYQALIMASIIEKESSYLAEQPLISSVFVNRLRKKMRLQTDPTVIYGLGDRYQGDITRAHLREKTAYNTYRINGLPPTPIALPGLSAIQATLNPDTSNYLYFVSGGDGKHVFSKTLTEHNRAVQQYLKKQKQKRSM